MSHSALASLILRNQEDSFSLITDQCPYLVCDCQQLVSSGVDRVLLWNIKSGVLQRDYHGHEYTYTIRFVTLFPNGQQLASASDDKTVRLWNPQTGEMQQLLTGHEGYIYSLAFSPGGQWLVSASSDKTIKVWNAATGRLRQVLEGHTDAVVFWRFHLTVGGWPLLPTI